jgi:negative regulator of flagellin synthesis FlgM
MDVYLHTVGNKLPPLSAKKNQAADLTAKQPRAGTLEATQPANASIRLSELKEMLAAAPMVDDEHVARVANAIQAGHYEINPQRAAEKMLEQELLLP